MNRNNQLLAILSCLLIVALNPACAQKKDANKQESTTSSGNAPSSTEQMSSHDSLSYFIGIYAGTHMQSRGIDSINAEWVGRGFALQFDKEKAVEVTEAQEYVEAYMKRAKDAKEQINLDKQAAYLAEMRKKDGVISLPSGLLYEVISMGSGPKPSYKSKILAHYHGTLPDGTVFDSSVERGEPAEFPVDQVIKGWTEALMMMPVGSKWKVYIPAELGYGKRGYQDIGPNQVLTFEMELIGIVKP